MAVVDGRVALVDRLRHRLLTGLLPPGTGVVGLWCD
jgi:hypothetical protein